MNYKLGSLFDGSGGFPLAGSLCGIEPCWASEVEPYPIAVTRERFPKMKHLGDISKINGAEVEPVDVITFGSPCQDLSVAGKRAGLKHEANGDEETTRSGLFMEAVRIIKEMRESTNGQYPSFALWENVPGAFSSNRGEDFRIVLEELIKIVEPSAVMPEVPKAGWAYADSYVGDGWSLVYRVFDAQYWGVPQRRRRIHLVLDLRGERAREVLFEREGVRGYFTKGGQAWEGTPGNAEGSTGADDRERETAGIVNKNNCLTPWDVQSRQIYTPDGPWFTLYAGEGGGRGYVAIPNGENTPVALAPVASTLRAGAGAPKHEQDYVGRLVLQQTEPQKEQYLFENHSQDTRYKGPLDVSPMLPAQLGTGGNNTPFVVEGKTPTYCLQGSMIGRTDKNGPQGDGVNETETLKASGGDLGGDSENLVVQRPHYIVRRLTPTECARLQGFANLWGYIPEKDTLTDEEYRFWLDVRNTHAAINGKPVKEYTIKQILAWYNKLYTDSAEYKMWGNGIALPPALYCMQGITDVLNARSGETAFYMEPTATEPEQTEENEATDLSGTPEEIKEEILKNNELLQERETEEEIKEDEKMEIRKEEPTYKTEEQATEFNVVKQLRQLAEERKLLAAINQNTPRFKDDVQAIEYAVTVLEAIGM